MAAQTRLLIIAALVAALTFAIGVIIGYFAKSSVGRILAKDADPNTAKQIQDGMSADNIKQYLRFLASKPHIGGKAREHELAAYIKNTWKDQGLDSAEFASYEVLLSYPDNQRPNKVSILLSNGTAEFTSQPQEPPLSEDQKDKEAAIPFNAFAPAGTVQGDLVYVNYGRAEDFLKLAELGVNCTGKIAIVKYGKIFRGNKLDEAYKAGAIGLIIYTDPADYTKGTENVYPDSWYMPPTGVQRGNVVTQKGDQLTPGYPATAHAYRMPEDKLKKYLPKIPCQPIGYGDAAQLLRKLGGNDAPEAWQGGLQDILPYKLGPGFRAEHADKKVKLEVNNKLERVTIRNVIGMIVGEIEPDRYVLLGNHRDAWVFGSIDPSSGTAVMLELTRVLGDLHKKGWRPRRTMVFCSWAAEEPGLVGSHEWVEENVKTLLQNAVAYLNVDSSLSGNYTFAGRASPLLRNALISATKKVPDPDGRKSSLYEVWKERQPSASGDEPSIAVLGSGSDFAPFIQEVGVPATDMRYRYNPLEGLAGYPLYHTLYETVSLTDMIDPTYIKAKAVGQVWGELGLNVAESLIVPLDANEYARALATYISDMKLKYGTQLAALSIQFGSIESAVTNFTLAAKRFHEHVDSIDKSNPMLVRMANDKLVHLERAFTDPAGLPFRPLYRHMIFAPGARDTYAGSVFSGMADLMFDIDNAPDKEERWEQVKQHFAVIVFTIQSAADYLKAT